jgi:hypothetical protein
MDESITQADRCHQAMCEAQRGFFRAILRVDTDELWWKDGARDTAHWLGMRYGISYWKAHRWIEAARALESLPALSEVLGSGVLGVDKVVELTRFATPKTEADLIPWAQSAPCAEIRDRGDELRHRAISEVQSAQDTRYWFSRKVDDGHSMLITTKVPIVEGTAVVKAVCRKADQMPVMPGEEGSYSLPQRRADALVAIASAAVSSDPDPDRATVIVHAQLDESINARIEHGPVLSKETTRRLMCDARVQTVLEDSEGNAFRLGRMTREPSPAMIRQLRHRDYGCRFPGCGFKAFTQAHHIVHWKDGGPTDLESLVIICSFHHKAVHELGWKVARKRDGTLLWRAPVAPEYRVRVIRPPRRVEPMLM